MRKKNIISSLAFILIGIWFSYLTYWLPTRTIPNTPGPSFFPWVIVICFLSLSILLLCKNFFDKNDKKEKSSISYSILKKVFVDRILGLKSFEDIVELAKDFFEKKVLILALIMLTYIALLPFTGFLLTTPFFFASFMYLTSEKRFLYIAFFSISIPFSIFYLFQNVFSILLPNWSF